MLIYLVFLFSSTTWMTQSIVTFPQLWLYLSPFLFLMIILKVKNRLLLLLLAFELMTLLTASMWAFSFLSNLVPMGLIFTFFTLAVGEATLGLSLMLRYARVVGSALLQS